MAGAKQLPDVKEELCKLKELSVKKHKLVVTRLDGTITKGYFQSDPAADLTSLARESSCGFPELLDSRYTSEDGTAISVDWPQVKAAFFVSTLTGDRTHDPVRFYSSGPVIQNVWVEVVFRDGEVVEGWIRNSLHHLTEPGFFLQPSTPGSNNLLIYVNKSAIMGYRVLGVRMAEEA